MHGVALLLAAAAIAYAFARAVRAPAIPFLLLAGLGLSLAAPPDAQILEDALLLGVSFLLFVVGLELDERRLRSQRRAALRVGTVQFVLLAVLGFGAARALGYGAVAASYLALALTASSTLLGVRLLQRRRQMFEPVGRLVLGVLLLQDALVLLAIPLVAAANVGAAQAIAALQGIVLIAGLSFVVRRWAAPLLLRVAHDTELVLLSSLAVLFVFLAIADLLGVPLVVGAFLGGVAFSRFPVNGVVRSELAPIGDFFTAIFFTSLGALVSIPSPGQLAHALVLILILLLVTPPLVALVAERAGFGAKPAIEAGLLLSQASEISLVIGLSGMLLGHIDRAIFTVIALTTLGSMLLTPVLATDAVATWLARLHPSRRRSPGEPPQDHALLLGTGTTGMPILEELVLSGFPVAVVDDDPAVLAQLADAGIRTFRGDAGDEAVLRQAGADRARVVSSTIRRPRDNEALLHVAAGVPVLVRVFDDADANWVAEHGGIPILYSEATADGLMEWFAEERDMLDASLSRRLHS